MINKFSRPSEVTVPQEMQAVHKMGGESKVSFDASSSSNDDESTLTLLGENGTVRRHLRFRKTALAIKVLVAFAVFLSTLSVVFTALKVREIASSYTKDYGDCGSNNSVEEARALGCVFDPMGWVWVRPECFDEKMANEFLNRTDFSWHTEPKLKPESQVPLDVVYSGRHPKLFTQRKYHYIHCAYMWKRMHKAILEKVPLDSYLTQWHHTNHCQKVMLNEWLHEDVECTPDMVCPTWVRATWTSCRRY